ncbi:Rec8 like protein-domain-containing protein [Geopyxis carbonaria]|nr:Rec8 like protein-domain-containing protein [Geopyxis carbonaria]
MFYSHEILTSRKYGVATVWLVATLGANRGDSALKKIGRKEILSVNVPKACDTIIHPDAPLALRLQSTLLIGISRVYRQQFDYLYHDVSQAHSSIKKFEGTRGTLGITTNVDLGQNRDIKQVLSLTAENSPDQLVLQDDPAFTLELLPEYNLDGLFQGSINENELLSVDGSVMGTPGSRTVDSFHASEIFSPGLKSASSGVGHAEFELPILEDREGTPLGRRPLERIEEDPGFEFTEDGELRELSPQLPDFPRPSDLKSPRQVSVVPVPDSDRQGFRVNSEDIAAQVQEEHDARHGVLENDKNADQMYRPNGEDVQMIDAASLFPEHEDQGHEIQTPEELVRGDKIFRAPRLQPIRVDKDGQRLCVTTELLRQWRQDYVQNMEIDKERNIALKVSRGAKAIAKMLVLEHGVGGQLKNPLLKSIFSGQALLDFLEHGNKRKRLEPEDIGTDIEEANKKVKLVNSRAGDEIGLVNLDEMMNGLEVGRDEPQPNLDDTFPWNRVSSRAGSVTGDLSMGGMPSSSVAGDFQELTGLKRPVSSNSPHTGRRPAIDRLSNIGSALGQVQELDEDNEDIRGFDNPVIDDSEFFGVDLGAAIKTQDADTQWLQQALDDQSYKMLEFLKTKIVEHRLDTVEDDEGVDFLTFEEVVTPRENRRIVAAQGLHHLLLLASRGLVYLSQEESYGSIQISIVDI